MSVAGQKNGPAERSAGISKDQERSAAITQDHQWTSRIRGVLWGFEGDGGTARASVAAQVDADHHLLEAELVVVAGEGDEIEEG